MDFPDQIKQIRLSAWKAGGPIDSEKDMPVSRQVKDRSNPMGESVLGLTLPELFQPRLHVCLRAVGDWDEVTLAVLMHRVDLGHMSTLEHMHVISRDVVY